MFADYHYVGTGDIGGAATESSVKLLEAIVDQGHRRCCRRRRSGAAARGRGSRERSAAGSAGGRRWATVRCTWLGDRGPDVPDITPAMTARLPRYKGDLELINHSAGSLTSQAYHKRWNCAERAAGRRRREGLGGRRSGWAGGPIRCSA